MYSTFLHTVASAKEHLFAFSIAAVAILHPFSGAAQQNYYSVKFPDDRTVVSCGGTADTIFPEITYYGNCSFNVGVSVKDQVFSLNNTGGCKKILRTWKLIWWCDYNPNWPAPTTIENPGSTDVGPTVMGDSYNHGYFQYTQIIKIVDNVAPVYLDCPSDLVVFCDYTNNDPTQYGNNCEGPVNLKMKVTDACSKSDLIVSYRLYLDLDGNGSMETFRSSSAPGAWPIDKTISGDTVSAKVVLPTGVGLPYGKHKIEWITNDRCGNEALCKYEFEVRDCKAPTVVCINGLSINIMPTGMITLWDSDFLQYTSDNCTPVDQIKIGIRKSGTGTGFPFDSHSVTFDCNEVGKQFVEIWAIDAYGNADYCETYVIVQDHFGACTPSGPVVGTVITDQAQPLVGAKILLKNNLSNTPIQSVTTSDASGGFAFSSAPGTCNYSIIPSLDTLPNLGVKTLDVLLTDMHISGQNPLNNPFRIIAADANRDGLLNSADLDAMNDLILGIKQTFPGNTAWRFVPSTFVFPNPAQPLTSSFPEKISTVCPVASGMQHQFTAIKTGDVDGSVFTGNKEEDFVYFSMPKMRFTAGQTLEVALITPALNSLKGFQFTLDIDPSMLTLLSAEPGSLAPRLGISMEQNRVAASWYSTSLVDGEQSVVVLKFMAVQAGSLSQAIEMTSTVASAEAYDQDLKQMGAALQFGLFQERNLENGSSNLLTAHLNSISPNPTAGPVLARFSLPEAGQITLSLTDLNGRVISTQNGYFEKGNHQLNISVEETGLYFLNLTSAYGTEVQRVIVQK